MSETGRKVGVSWSNPVLRCLADGRRRQILSTLRDRSSSVDGQDLAVHCAAAERDVPLVEVSREEMQSVHVRLVHDHLPALDDAGLVAWDADEGTAATTDHPAHESSRFEAIVETDAEGVDDAMAALTVERRRIALAALEERDDAVPIDDLAREVAAREASGAPDAGHVDRVVASLHHFHLPVLRDAGLVEDADGGGITYSPHPAVETAWFDFESEETPRAVLPSATRSADVWTVEGRSNVLSRGQSMVHGADEEVFLMITTDGLLEEECFRAIEDAVDRGVDVYLGSQTAGVRDQVRRRCPEVTIWEPQLDWLNLPPRQERLGRLVFVDREAIMLGTLGEQGPDGVRTETAITGAGDDNALVVLVRELLGGRLDHLDAQSADFRSQIPL